MNKENPQNNSTQQSINRSKFSDISFEELIKTCYERVENEQKRKEIKKEIEDGWKIGKMRPSHISHLYLGFQE